MSAKITGLIAAPFTAFHADGSLNLGLVERQAQALVDQGVAGAFICGTTGEGVSLTTDERLQVAEEWSRVRPKNFRLIVHVGHQAVGESRRLSTQAEQLRADAFAATAPAFFRPARLEQLVGYCTEVAAAAPALPFYYYHIPSMTGVELPMRDFLEMAAPRIPNLAGLKFTHENLMDYQRCLEFDGGRFDILFGRDELLLAGLAVGAKGAVGSTYNFQALLFQQLIEAFGKGDLERARRCQTLANQVIALMIQHGGLPAGKAMMKATGLDCGPVRVPLQNPSAAGLQTLNRELAKLGFPFTPSFFERGL